ncbi:hypothetical protein GW755_02855 [bacterium]|nr:hypothetical protein [bacterium]
MTPKFIEKKIVNGFEVEIEANGVSDLVKLHAYCLMPNHFHLLVQNVEIEGVQLLMRRVLTAYVRVFNKKYEREGPLIQGSYRCVPIHSEPQLIHTSRYVHLNPLKDRLVKKSIEYPYSSLKFYYNGKNFPIWLKRNAVIQNSTDFGKLDTLLKVFEKEDNPI